MRLRRWISSTLTVLVLLCIDKRRHGDPRFKIDLPIVSPALSVENPLSLLANLLQSAKVSIEDGEAGAEHIVSNKATSSTTHVHNRGAS